MNTCVYVMNVVIMAAFDPLEVIDVTDPSQQGMAMAGLLACMVIDFALHRRSSRLRLSEPGN